MHAYVMARGMVDQLNRWENNLLAVKLPYTYGHQHGEAGNPDLVAPYQLGVRPVRMYEICFPKPQLNNVMNLLRPTKSWNPSYDKYLWGLQKAMGLAKIPQYIQDKQYDAFQTKWIDCTGIGLKEDRFENGIEQI